MAIGKFQKNKHPLEEELIYIRNQATHNNDIIYYDGIACDPYQAYDDFLLCKELWGKTTGIQSYHIIVSLEANELVSNNLPVAMFQNIANVIHYFSRSQIAYAIHSNTKQLHAHYIVNSVSYIDGHKHDFRMNDIRTLYKSISNILVTNGYQPIRTDYQK